MRKRFNLVVDEKIKEQIKAIALEINPDRPRVQDVLELIIMIRNSDPRTYKIYLQKFLANRRRGLPD